LVFEELLREWDGEQAVVRFDRPSGAWMFICIHSTRLGPAGGGTRMRVYATPSDGLRDGMRLAAGMTRKMAVLGVPFGGGKAVLAVPELPNGEARRALLLRYGDLVSSLGGTFRTAADMNTTAADVDVIGERSRYVYGRSAEHGGGGDSGVGTARGVFHGIRASLLNAYGSDDLTGRSVLVQGVGSVGGHLARNLAEEGAELILTDVADERASELAAELGARVVAAERALETECDVYAPCAVGGTLDRETIPQLGCRIVAGSANNQLAEPADAERLRAAGILYAPDYVINAGGVLQLMGIEDLGWDTATLEENLAGIGTTLGEIYAAAEAEAITTADAAERLATARLSAA
jgi:leucine dehydrogenase